jgi:outer membrane receptor protein involved in Fe transport
LNWNASLFHTDVHDDIYAVATSLSSGYFQNIGGTRRQGAEVGARYENARLSAFVNYSYVAATFQSTFLLPSSLNSAADAKGNILVRPGDALPGIPAHRIRTGFDFRVIPSWTVGARLVYESHQYFRGDESNQMPALAGFVVVNLHAKYQLTDRVELFANVVNLFNRQYATFGVLGDPTGVGAPGVPAGAATNDPGVDNRFESPAPPFSAFAGARVRF